ncbi:MAG: HEAT repeat domain-containing protein [Isosphaeraceae bacterium]
MNRKRYLPMRLCAGLLMLLAAPDRSIANPPGDSSSHITRMTVAPGESRTCPLGEFAAGQTYRILANIDQARIDPRERVHLELTGAGSDRISKLLHAGDPDVFLSPRPSAGGPVRIVLTRGRDSGSAPLPVRVVWRELPLADSDRAAIEAEPNDSWRQACPLRLGRDVYGTADDVDYLNNTSEGKSGLDWFRFKVDSASPILVYFQLDLLDRDVSANLRVYTVDPKTGEPRLYLAGKDPMEIIHDRERERYSKHISRTFTKGTYYLEVNANHPAYILRTRVLPVPPYDDPAAAVEAGMHYMINAGDAWFAQVPREGNIFVRANNIHDTAMRCTGCHASSFPTEAGLAAHKSGYPIRSKSNFQYVMDRIANSITPLYSDDGLYWQRFIAVPLQAQGLQGAILADYEREVTGRQSAALERFGPFLKASWAGRKDMPDDENNNVIPLDSKFGIAWRDWKVLTELARRTGRPEDARVAARLAEILGQRAADRRAESLQDRLHRLHAWMLIDREKFANKIKREIGALLELQNADGGWHESDEGPGPSAVYVTGQFVFTLLELGLPRDHPAIARALHYLLAQQQDFGGWFQTTTHENFRTPMRETRYAVMALARAFPRPGAPLESWGNRDDGPARPPRTDSLVHTLDDLENLWDVPAAEQPRYAAEIPRLLADADPRVRATAAACLGRLGRPEAVEPLVKCLGDPSKIVWRAAAWALRRLGNEGIGVDAIKAALQDPDPRVRRGATRIFAYQFYGMDSRLDLAERLIELTADTDLWTRLQALRTLRQWFYRTADTGLRRRIIATYLARMAQADVPVIRKNLSEGLYIMLDENLGGGVSLQKNIAELPEALRPGILQARQDVERDVLLTPLLRALEAGNPLQRAAVLQAFDGSFFKGRSYARQPSNTLDVGNDREFGFLYEPPLDLVERTFIRLLETSRQDSAHTRRQAIQLCSFFKIPDRTENAAIQTYLLEALDDPDATVRETARSVVGRELALSGAEKDPQRVRAIAAILSGDKSSANRASVLGAIGRNPRLGDRPEIKAAIMGLLHRDDAAGLLLPVLGRSDFSDAQRLEVLDRGWERLDHEARGRALDLLFANPELLDRAEPPARALALLRKAATDPSAQVRERTLTGLSALPSFWSSRSAAQMLLFALADDAPAIRKLGLTLSASKSTFWKRADALEHLARLLIDPDANVRSAALDLVKHHRLVPQHPALARRVKALADDPNLQDRALAVLRAAGVEPSSVKADVPLSRPRLPSLATFRRTVNPLFYQAGDDTYACARCHGNHRILRIAQAEPGRELTGDQLMINYNSALKVVNLGEPELSLLLKKPLSPEGQGGADESSPTGLTHVGGPRWSGPDHPEYKAILAWIREASVGPAGDREPSH